MVDVFIENPRFSIYGEIHNQIDNDAYKTISSSFQEDEIVLCEHTTHIPFLDLEDHAFKHCGFDTFLEKFKGSEWIYVKRKSEEKPVVCVDVRAENGFPLSVEEIQFEKTGLSNPISCLTFVRDVLSTAIKNKEIYKKYKKTAEMYEHLTSGIMKSYTIIMNFFRGKDEESDVFGEFDKLSVFLRRLSGLFIDIHIIDLLVKHCSENGSHISVFVGARHALTIFHILKDIGEQFENTECYTSEVCRDLVIL